MTTPPPAEGKTRLVEDILAWVNTPWRAVALLVLVLLCGIGYGLWTVRVQLADRVLKDTPIPHLEGREFPQIAERLIVNSGVDLVILMEVDFASDHVQAVDGRLKGNADWRPKPVPRELFQSSVSISDLSNLIAGKAVCQVL